MTNYDEVMSSSTFSNLCWSQKKSGRKLFITINLSNSFKNLEEMITTCKDDNTKSKKQIEEKWKVIH